jgi:hypothetical protein
VLKTRAQTVVSSRKEALIVKGLVFNLLDRLARNAGCSDAVWGLVADFAATEATLAGARLGSMRPGPGPASSPFALSAEALVHCFAANQELGDEDGLPGLEFEPDGDWAEADDADDRDSELPPESFQLATPRGGFRSNAFLDWNRLAGLASDDDE